MSEKDAKTWRKLAALFPPTEEQREQACLLYQQFLKGKAWTLSQEEVLDLDLPIIFDFYYRLALFTTPGRVYSRKQSTNWFSAMHVYQIDLRQISGWLGLLKMAPLFSHQAVVLQPFCQCANRQSELVTSHVSLDETLHPSALEEQGLSLMDFLLLVFEALRRLKIAIGFTLYPFVSEHAIACEKKPEIFTTEATQQRRFFNFTHPDAISYLINVCHHYAKTYGFDFVYYDFTSIQDKLSKDFWHNLETDSRIATSFAILGGISFPLQQIPPYLLPLSSENFPLSKIKLKDVDQTLLPLISFLGIYTSIFPCILTSREQSNFADIHIDPHMPLPVFDRKNVCYDAVDYAVWMWGGKHEITILLAVWENQDKIEIQLSDWLRGDSFYQQIIWTFHGHQLSYLSDELLSTTTIAFIDLVAGDARVILIKT